MVIRMKLFIVLIALMILSGCSTDANIASKNLANASEMFELHRRIIFYNAWIGEYMLVVEGACSIEKEIAKEQLAVTCKTGPESFKKHHLGVGGNVSYFSEQIKSSSVDIYHYRVVFKPESIIPNIDLETSLQNKK